jgi:ribonuclease III
MPRRSARSRTPLTTSRSTPPSSDIAPSADLAAALAARLGIGASHIDHLAEALVHGSFVNEHPEAPLRSNARLEFLGDAVVSIVVSQALYERHPDEDEGALTARRSAIVSGAGLARLAVRAGLQDFVVLGQGAERSGERNRISVLAATFEAVAGALYLDRGLAFAGQWLLGLAAEELDAAAALSTLKSPKSLLQEASYDRWGSAPEYRLVSADGPDHARHYVVDVFIGGRLLGTGEGGNRRDAETAAAARAVDILLGEPIESPASVDSEASPPSLP